MRRTWVAILCVLLLALAIGFDPRTNKVTRAQAAGPTMLVPNLAVREVICDLVTPIAMAFIGPNDFLLLEKNTGKVQRVVNGAVQSTVLDLGVNFASERGLLGIALHPGFPTNRGVYLFWSCQGTPPPESNPFFPVEQECADTPQLGADSDDVLAVPLLGNRVDRFEWNGSTLTFDHNLVKLLSFQNDGAPEPPNQGDEAQPPRANHDGGVLAFGHDGKLYIMFGDAGRRGQLQNLPSGPTLTGLGPTVADDQFGGPQPDDAHFTGAIIRLNDDGSTPADNPFFAAGAAMGGEVGENVQKIFAYGIRNSFGMAFDPLSGNLWDQENGEDAFDEMNLVEPGMNSGWIQIQGPASRSSRSRRRLSTTRTSRTFSSSAGGPSGSPTPRRRLCHGCSSCPARATPIPSTAGRTCSRQRRSGSSTRPPSDPSGSATCSSGSRSMTTRSAED